MKKILASLLAASLLAMGTAAFAATYDVDENRADVPEASGAQTILITAGENTPAAEITADNIVYINQSDDANGFGTAVKFLLKAGVSAGTYTVRTNTNTDGTTFKISPEEANGEKAMEVLALDNNPTTRAFTMPSVKIDEYKSILVTYTNEKDEKLTLKYPFSKISGLAASMEGTLKFGLQIDGVPEAVKDMAVSLSKEDVTKNTSTETETPAEETTEPAAE